MDIQSFLSQPLLIIVISFDLLLVALFLYIWYRFRTLEQSLYAGRNLVAEQVEAQARARAIITTATAQAQQILADTQEVKDVLHKRLLETFEQVLAQSKGTAQEKVELFNSQVERMMVANQAQHMQALDKLINDTESYLRSQSDTFVQEMQNHVLTFGKEDRTYMESELKRIKQELEEYKKQELTKISANIYEILARTSEAVLGKAVNLDLHQELVIKALEQAKRDGVFI